MRPSVLLLFYAITTGSEVALTGLWMRQLTGMMSRVIFFVLDVSHWLRNVPARSVFHVNQQVSYRVWNFVGGAIADRVRPKSGWSAQW